MDVGGPELDRTAAPRRAGLGPVVLAVVLGTMLGFFGRHVPEWVALHLLHPSEPASCTMERAVECAFRDLPTVLGAMFDYLLAVLAIVCVAGVAGAAVAVVGAGRLTREIAEGAVDLGGVVLLVVGSALLGPALWLAVPGGPGRPVVAPGRTLPPARPAR